jgi:hypothetical protein
MAFSFLWKEHSATVTQVKDCFWSVDYYIEGEGIPKGNKMFSIRLQELVKDVFAITIE